MNVKFLFLGLIVAAYLLLRIDIFVSLPILKEGWQFYVSLGFINSVLIYLIARKYLDITGALLSVLAYSSSPLIAYYEFSTSPYLVIATLMLFITGILQSRRFTFLNNYYKLIIIFIALISSLFFLKVGQITLYSDSGVINGLNQLRGESIKSGFGLESKIIENRYNYLGAHFLFNFLEQFSPAVYFSPEYKILGFSFSPPILFGFLITVLIGLVSLGSNPRNLLFTGFIFSIFILPSALSKNSPDSERLIIAVPLICFLSGFGFSKLSVFWPRYVRTLKLIFFILIIFQFIVILFDISLREPVRLMLLRS